MAQRVTASYVAEVLKRRECDRLAAYDRHGRARFDYREGSPEQLAEQLDDITNNTVGPFVVEVWRTQDRRHRRALADQALRFTLIGEGQDDAQTVQGTGVGPSWREFFDLREQLLRRDLEAQRSDESSELIRQALPIARDLVRAVMMRGGQVPAPVQGAKEQVAQPNVEPAQATDELREVLRAVAVIYKNDPDSFAQYAPFITSKAAELQKEPTDESAKG